MPNWTSNTIRAEGDEIDLRAFLEAVKWEDQIFDFNRIIPIPELLKHTGSGGRTIDGREVREWYVINPETDPLTDDKSVRLFTPEEEATLKEIGHRSWYTWCYANWGTKWNACHPELSEDCVGDGYIENPFRYGMGAANARSGKDVRDVPDAVVRMHPAERRRVRTLLGRTRRRCRRRVITQAGRRAATVVRRFSSLP
jgi:hypothetical protein